MNNKKYKHPGKVIKKAKNKVEKCIIFLFHPKTQLNEYISHNMREYIVFHINRQNILL